MDSDITRRGFLATSGGALAWAMAPGLAGAHRRDATDADQPSTILFQGDSITDGGRTRADAGPNSAASLGYGYPLLIAASLLQQRPERGLRFFNRGVSGNRVPDLRQRWTADTIDLKPDILSILIGVNDLWHKLAGKSTGTVAEYESGYDELLQRTRAALPAVRLVVLEPFVLRCGVVTEQWFPEFDDRRAAAARVARKAGATFLPLQRMFDDVSRRAQPAYWAADGVHPTPAGHAAIARAWQDAVKL
jgi:lysophospholipase L1-like esterase